MNLPLRILSGTAYALLLGLASIGGVQCAKMRLSPEQWSPPPLFAAGTEVQIGGDHAEVFAASEQKVLRDFLFARENGIDRKEWIKSGKILVLKEVRKARIEHCDADMACVSLEQGTVWVRLDQCAK